MSLLKLSVLLLSSVSFHLCLGPTVPPGPEDHIMMTSIRERIWRHAGIPSNLFLKATTWLTTAAESTVILGSLWCPSRSHPADPLSVLLAALGPAEASAFSVPFFVGTSLVIAGGLIRVQSFRALGPYFTFELCIRKEHTLVTHGPYALVRHPGYMGLLMCIFGWYVVHGDPRSWLRMSGALDLTWVRVWLTCWAILMAACIMTLFRRATEEDLFLSRRFETEWECWARRVRYKLVPFVY